MAGKLCFGEKYNNAGPARISQSKAYCDGIAYRSAGTALAQPKTDNPHPAGSPDADAWDNGWDQAEAAAGGILPKSQGACCAVDRTLVIQV